MKTIERPASTVERPRSSGLRREDPGYQAYSMLYLVYTALPLIAGADKFGHYLVDWNQYLAPFAAQLLGVQADLFMRGVGMIEIAAGLLVAVRPRWGALVVGLWYLGIVGNLLMIPGYFDVALRDFGLAVGAFSLWRLSGLYSGRTIES